MSLAFDLNHYQAECILSKSKFTCLITGVGTGKTLALLLKAWNHCEQYPGASCMIVRKEKTDLRDSTMRDFTRYFGKKTDQKDNYNFPNGSQIMFRHGNINDIAVLKNVNLSFAGIEQGEEYDDDEVFAHLRERLRMDKVPVREMCVIANAKGMNWLWKIFVSESTEVKNFNKKVKLFNSEFDTGESYYSKVDLIHGKEQKYECWTANSFVNAHNLPEDTLIDWLSMEKNSPNHYKQMIMNSFDEIGDGDILLTSDEIHKALNQEFLFNKDLFTDKIMGVDIAADGNDSCFAVLLEQRGPMHWEETLFDSWQHEDVMYSTGKILALRSLWSPSVMVVDAQGMGEGVYWRIKENGIDVVGYRGGMNKDIKNKQRFTNRNAEDAFFVKENLIGDSRLKIRPEVVPELQTVKFGYDSSGGKIKMIPKVKMTKSPDHWDALRMACSQVESINVDSYQRKVKQPRVAKAMNPWGATR